MEPLFQFIGQYWWLVFPLFGVMASIGSAWERGARRRHKRRLEVLHAKAELKAAQAAARGRTAPIPVQPPNPYTERVNAAVAAAMGTTPGATPVAAPVGTQLERLFASHDAVTARWLEYELDVAKIIAFPAMSDGRQPLTAAFLRAKKIADGLRPASAKAKLSKDQIAEYRSAVTDFEVAFDVAERDARRIKDSSFSETERKRLDTAKKLLTVAIDQAATPAERQLAYRRVREQLDGLISLSDEAIEVLEAKVALELTTGTLPQAAPRGAPAADAPPTPPADAPPADAPRADAPRAATAPSTTPPAPRPGPDPRSTWPVPARNAGDVPGRVVHPKSHP